MSWFARSLVDSFKAEEDDDVNEKENEGEDFKKQSTNEEEEEDTEEEDPTRGVKEDLSELTKTLTRQFWGVASFFAPPPSDQGQSSDPTVDDESETLNSPRLAGIRSGFVEIGGRFKSGISLLSSTKAVSEISKIASNLLPFGSEEDEVEKYEGGGLGVSEEVVAFAGNLSMHRKTWLDFPSIPDDFDMSDAQQEHALAVEHLAPSLAALRIDLCPSHMSEGRFWKIYFVLLHSRLNRQDADLLTTPQIVEARALLLQDFPNRQKPVPSDDESFACIPITEVETEKHPVQITEVKIIDKCVVKEDPPVVEEFEEDVDDWLEEEEEEDGEEKTVEAIGLKGNDEDVSFSDLEEEDDDDQGTSKTRVG